MPGQVGGSNIPFSAGGTGTGGTVYTPSAQPQQDLNYQQILSNWMNQYNAGQQPAQQALPLEQQTLNTISGGNFSPQAIGGAQAGSQTGTDLGGAAATAGSSYLPQLLSLLQPLASNTANLSPAVSGLAGLNAGLSSPVSSLAQQTAGYAPQVAGLASPVSSLASQTSGYAPQVAGYGTQAAALAPQVAGLAPQVAGYGASAAGYAPQVAAGMGPLQQGAQSILQTAFDPQNALYSRTLQQVTDQSNATNSMYGLSASPYGAGLANQATSNFNIDWQNQQLARQQAGLGAAGSAYGQAGALGTEAGGLYNTGANDAALSGGLLNQAGGLYNTAGGLLGQAGTINNAATNQYTGAGNLLTGAGNLNTAGGGLYNTAGGLNTQAGNLDIGAGGLNTTAGNAYSNILPSLSSGVSLGSGAGGLQASAGGLPYQTYLGQQQNISNAITPYLSQANQQYTQPQQTIQDILNYLTGGQNASQVSGNLGNMGFNQGQQQLQNIGSALGGLGSFAGGLSGTNLSGLGGLGSSIASWFGL